jgi:hypothetical protein
MCFSAVGLAPKIASRTMLECPDAHLASQGLKRINTRGEAIFFQKNVKKAETAHFPRGAQGTTGSPFPREVGGSFFWGRAARAAAPQGRAAASEMPASARPVVGAIESVR